MGILRAFSEGIVTSTTLMATGAAFAQAVESARANPDLAVGCHLSIIGGAPVASPGSVPSLIDSVGHMPRTVPVLLARLARGVVRGADIEREFRAQVRHVVAAGVHPTHLDTHKHAHAHPRVLEAMLRVARDFGIRSIRNPYETFHYPKVGAATGARRCEYLKQYALSMGMKLAAVRFRQRIKASGLITPDFFFGVSLTGLLDVAAITGLIRSLKEGTTELVCHPGFYDQQLERAPTRLKKERGRELEALTDPEVRRCLAGSGVTLMSYRELPD